MFFNYTHNHFYFKSLAQRALW